MTNSEFFRHLRDKKHSAQAFETGHAAYARFLSGALKWAQIVFAPELDPDRNDDAFPPKGYRQDILADAMIRTLMAMPIKPASKLSTGCRRVRNPENCVIALTMRSKRLPTSRAIATCRGGR